MTAGEPGVVRLEGEIDLANAGETIGALEDRIETLDTVDLSDVTYLDSAGVHRLFSVARKASAAGRRLHVVVPRTSPVRHVVDIAGLGAVATITD